MEDIADARSLDGSICVWRRARMSVVMHHSSSTDRNNMWSIFRLFLLLVLSHWLGENLFWTFYQTPLAPVWVGPPGSTTHHQSTPRGIRARTPRCGFHVAFILSNLWHLVICRFSTLNSIFFFFNLVAPGTLVQTPVTCEYDYATYRILHRRVMLHFSVHLRFKIFFSECHPCNHTIRRSILDSSFLYLPTILYTRAINGSDPNLRLMDVYLTGPNLILNWIHLSKFGPGLV